MIADTLATALRPFVGGDLPGDDHALPARRVW